MPSSTIYTTTGPRWGDTGFTSSTSKLYVGKSGTTTYYGYVGFPAINPAWTIKSISFRLKREDTYSTHVLQFGSSTSNAWGSKGTQDWKADFSVSSGTGTKSWDLTAYKDILQGYTGTWYMHVQHGSGTNSYTEFTGGTGSSPAPRLYIEYEDSSVTVPGDQFTIGVQSTMTVGNAGSGLTHDLTYSIGAASGTLATGVAGGAPVNWTPAATLANQITTDMVGDVTLTLKSYLSGVLQSTITLTFPLNVPATYVPVITPAPVFALQNPTGDTIGVYVQNRSWTKCTITATQSYSAPIVEYRVTISGATTTSATNVVTTGALTQYGVLAATVVVVDSRGQTATWNTAAAMTVYEYFAPMVTSFSLFRCDAGGVASNTGTSMKYVLSVVFAPINNLNTKGGTVAYKVAGAPSYGTAVALNTISAYSATVSGVIGVGAITAAGYTVLVTLTDKYNNIPVEASLASSKIWFDLHSSGEGMAIGKAASTASLFDVGIKSNFDQMAQMRQGFYVHGARGTQGSAGWVQICRLTIIEAYTNCPFEITLSQRGLGMLSRLYVYFLNFNGTDPTLASFTYTGRVKSAYIYRSAAGVWDVYVEKTETYDAIGVVDYKIPFAYMDGVIATWTDVHAATVPVGATKATYAYDDGPYRGSVTFSVAASGQVNVTIPYTDYNGMAITLPAVPKVQAFPVVTGGGGAADSGAHSIYLHAYNVTTTNFMVRVFNESTWVRSGTLNWLAYL